MTRLDAHRVITVPDEWFAEHLQIDRWPGSGPARHVVIGRAMPLRGPRFRTSCRAVFHRLAGFAASIAIAALWSAVTLYAISLWVVS